MRMDRMVEEAFRLNIKWSLQELSRAINGDGKTLPNPLFKVKVILTDKIEFSPSIEELEGYVCSISGRLIKTVSEFRRLPDILAGKKKGRQVIQIFSYLIELVDSMWPRDTTLKTCNTIISILRIAVTTRGYVFFIPGHQ